DQQPIEGGFMSATTVRPIAGTTYGPTPPRTVEQRKDALRKANAIRVGNAQLRKDLRALPKPDALRRVADLLEHPEGYVESMPIGRLLLAVERIGVAKVGKLLTLAGIRSADKRVGGLTQRQR